MNYLTWAETFSGQSKTPETHLGKFLFSHIEFTYIPFGARNSHLMCTNHRNQQTLYIPGGSRRHHSHNLVYLLFGKF